MQTAVHAMAPQLLPQYPHSSLNRPLNGNSTGMPTPPATRKRKRATHQYTVSYSEVQEVDSNGHLREVIVIDDTPPPPTISPSTTHNGAYSASYQPPMYGAPVRTRARAAAEAQAQSASSSSVMTAPAPKKRKRDHNEGVRAPATKKAAADSQQSALIPNNSWGSRSAAATDDVSLSLLPDFVP